MLDVVATVNPTENLEAWVNFDWVHNFGKGFVDADKFGIAGAARVAVAENTRLASRVEYLTIEDRAFATDAANDAEILTVTGTADQEVADGLHIRGELRWDRVLARHTGTYSAGAGDFASGDKDQLVGLVEMYYEF